MNEQEVSSVEAEDRAEQFAAGVQALRVPNQTDVLERRLYWAGILLPIIGLIVIGLGWWGASGTKFVYQEIPYLISGGLFGVALVFMGAALFARNSAARLFRFCLARVLVDHQTQTDQVVDAIRSLTEAVKAQAVTTDRQAR